ncbi:MAG TPA: hypothetical protein VGD78_07420 [Chthoniobacterales bacterium]
MPLLKPFPSTDAPSLPASHGFLANRMLITSLVVFAVLLVRLHILKKYGVQEPFMDSFSEVHDLKAALAGNFGAVWRDAFELHNEHRLVLTKWLNVGLFLLNGGHWDLLAGAMANAFLAAGCVWAAAWAFGRELAPAAYNLLLGILALCWVLPFSYENMLWDFQSQHFFFILFSVLNVGLSLPADRLGAKWWTGWSCGVLACLSVGSGFYAPLVTAGAAVLMLFRAEHRNRVTAGTALGSGVTLACYLPFVLQVHSYAYGKADSVGLFLTSLVRHLAFPNIPLVQVWVVPIMWLPLILLTLALLFHRRALPASSYQIIALTAWTLLIDVSLAFLRGKYAPYVRYFDYNSFQIVLSLAATLEIWRLDLFPRVPLAARSAFLAGWLGVVGVGCFNLFQDAWAIQFPIRRQEMIDEQKAVREFLATRDPEVLVRPELNGVFPFSREYYRFLGETLVDPQINSFLPPAMKGPVEHEAASGIVSRVRMLLLHKLQYLTVAYEFIALVLVGAALGQWLSRPENQEKSTHFWQALRPG